MQLIYDQDHFKYKVTKHIDESLYNRSHSHVHTPNKVEECHDGHDHEDKRNRSAATVKSVVNDSKGSGGAATSSKKERNVGSDSSHEGTFLHDLKREEEKMKL